MIATIATICLGLSSPIVILMSDFDDLPSPITVPAPLFTIHAATTFSFGNTCMHTSRNIKNIILRPYFVSLFFHATQMVTCGVYYGLYYDWKYVLVSDNSSVEYVSL